MKKHLLAVLALFAAIPSFASYKGSLEYTNPQAVVFRELYDGMWLAGAQDAFFHVTNVQSGNELFHVSFFWVTRLEGQDTMYGPSLGVNLGQGFYAFAQQVEAVAPSVAWVPPPWVAKAGNYTTVEGFGGYRKTVSPDDHHWGYGFGFEVNIPISDVVSWAKGTPGVNVGL